MFNKYGVLRDNVRLATRERRSSEKEKACRWGAPVWVNGLGAVIQDSQASEA